MSGIWNRLPFRGTFGQTAILVSAALLIAQGIGFFLLVNERDRWRLLDAVQPAIQVFVSEATELEKLPPSKQAEAALYVSRPDAHFMIDRQGVVARFGLTHERELERRLEEALEKSGMSLPTIEATSTGFANSPPNNRPILPMWLGPDRSLPRSMPSGPEHEFGPPDFALGQGMWPNRSLRINSGNNRFGPPFHHQEINFALRLKRGAWLNAQFISIRPPPAFLWRLVIAELVLFAVVLSVALLLAARSTRPMTDLASASEHLTPGHAPPLVRERGPQDIRAAIRSFNAMTTRVGEMLREKDRMLGAIGHDLRTPLASLRVRAESVEPSAERERFVATIDDMSRMVESILDLARLGHAGEAAVPLDLVALADAVVEQFLELGCNVNFIEAPRHVVTAQPVLLRRLLRNLIENALKFGQSAEVSVSVTDGQTVLSVIDNGPGIPPEDLARVLEPFTRLEESRSKNTGGIGIGLSIAQSIAKSQGAELVLENLAAGGLAAHVIWK